MKTDKQRLEKKWPILWPDKVGGNWKNHTDGWYIKNPSPGLYILDIEHIPNGVVEAHNDPTNPENVSKRYRTDLCLHKCSFCFNEDNFIYGTTKRDLEGKVLGENKMMGIEKTFEVIDQAIEIAKDEGHKFQGVKFLGPGELLINTDLFKILDEYQKRNIHIGIFTKGAVLGEDSLSQKYHNLGPKELTDKLAGYKNVSLIFSFQSFNEKLQNKMVTTKTDEGEIKGLQNYSSIREKAIDNLFNSSFYEDGITNRVCMINAPIIPENIDESFEIYKFFTERGTPVVMTPSMVSGKGCGQVEREKEQISLIEWNDKLVNLYARIYDFNVRKGIQSSEEIEKEGIASYVGAAPCNQSSTGLYVRANGFVQMCPGRFDKETFFGDLEKNSLKEIWDSSQNKQRGIKDSHNLINNRCPAKDGIVFMEGFYEKVMDKYLALQKN